MIFLHWKILFQWVLIKCFLNIKMENKLIPVSSRLMYFTCISYCIRTWSTRWHIVFDSIAEIFFNEERSGSTYTWNALMFVAPVQIHQRKWKRAAACDCVVICEGNTSKWRFLIFVIYIIKIICPFELSCWCASSTAQCSDFKTAGDRGAAVHITGINWLIKTGK